MRRDFIFSFPSQIPDTDGIRLIRFPIRRLDGTGFCPKDQQAVAASPSLLISLIKHHAPCSAGLVTIAKCCRTEQHFPCSGGHIIRFWSNIVQKKKGKFSAAVLPSDERMANDLRDPGRKECRNVRIIGYSASLVVTHERSTDPPHSQIGIQVNRKRRSVDGKKQKQQQLTEIDSHLLQ